MDLPGVARGAPDLGQPSRQIALARQHERHPRHPEHRGREDRKRRHHPAERQRRAQRRPAELAADLGIPSGLPLGAAIRARERHAERQHVAEHHHRQRDRERALVGAARVANLARDHARVFPSAEIPDDDRESAAEREREVRTENLAARRMPVHEMAEAEHDQRRERRQQQRRSAGSRCRRPAARRES